MINQESQLLHFYTILYYSFSFRWIKKDEEVGKVVEALNDIQDIVTKEDLIVELKKVGED